MSHSFAAKQAPGLTIPARLALALALAVGLILSLAPAPVAAQVPTVLYVTPGGSGDCSTWATACTLQTALGAAVSGDEIWVAQGTHTPGTLRTDTFTLKNGVAVYGGFAGTETARSQRDWVAHPTVLSGEIGTPGDNGDNAYHVVTSSGTDASAVLDGFTITAGNADGSNPDNRGGGMYNFGGSPTLTHVTFNGNSATLFGGGMYNDVSSNPTLTDVTFNGNSADVGGGMMNGGSSPTLTNVTFSGNSAATSGGGMLNVSSSPTLTNVTFSGNSADYSGGGMYNSRSSPTLTNVTFSGNSADYGGGGVYNEDSSSPTLTNVTFSGNSANLGGGMYNSSSSPTLVNCILWGNTASSGSQIYDSSSTPTITYSDVQGGYAGTGNIDADPLFVDADGPDDVVGTPDDNLRLRANSPAVDAGDNTAPGLSGITTDLDGTPRFVDVDAVTDTGNGTAPIVDMGAYEAGLLYVDQSATGANDGSSWADAYTDLQSALGAAGSSDEIWVAEGTYTPGTLRTDSFQLKSGVGVYGGFAGTETALSQRDWAAHPTVLSGEIGAAGNSDNAYHVVTGSGTDATAVLDGFTVSGGNANGSDPDHRGGGMYTYSGSPRLANVTFSGNSASNRGGGMYTYSGSPRLTDVTFSGNSAASLGGGMYNNHSSPTLTDATFSSNSAAYGGGMYTEVGNPTLINVTFSGNSATSGWGGGMVNWNSNSTLTNVTFSGNSASTGGGGGVYNEHSSHPTLTNCILWGNAAPQIAYWDSSATVTYSDVQGGHAGIGNIDADPLFVDADGPDDVYGTLDDNLRLHATSPAVDAGDDTAVPASITTDLDGNPRTMGAAVDMGAYETLLPAVVSITRAGVNPTNAASAPFTVTFNVPVVGVDATAFDLTTTGGQGGATLGPVSGVSETWTVTVSTVAGMTGTIRLDLQDTDTITATPGVPLGGTGAGNGDFTTGEVYTVDRVAPTVSLASTAPNPTNLATIPVTVTFSEDVSGFTAGDVTTGNGTPGNFAAVSGAVYTFDLTPTGQGLVTADVAAGVAQDSAGNGNSAAAQFSRTYDSVAPTVTIDQAAGQPDPTGTAPISFTVVFDEPVSGFDGGDVDFSASTAPGPLGAAVTEIAPLDGTTYHVAVSGMTGPGEVIASIAAGAITDLASNPNAASTSTDNSVTFDPNGPVVISLDAPDVAEYGASVYTITVVYSDSLALDVSSLGDGDLRVTGPGGFDQLPTFVGVTPAGDGTPRTATYHVTPPGGAWDDADRGAYTIALEAGQVQDTLGNAAAAGTLGTFNVGGSYQIFLPLVIR